jgi:hypothetical protein
MALSFGKAVCKRFGKNDVKTIFSSKDFIVARSDLPKKKKNYIIQLIAIIMYVLQISSYRY